MADEHECDHSECEGKIESLETENGNLKSEIDDMQGLINEIKGFVYGK